MKKTKLISLILLACLCLVAFSACGWLENLQLFKGEAEDPAAQPPSDQVDPTVINNDLDIAEPPADGTQPEANAPTLAPEDAVQVVLYFASSDGSTLEAETRAIPKQEGLARATVNQLIAGPLEDGLFPTLPAATILDDINIRDGVCTVDFSPELIENISGDSQQQLLAVYSIVNTLTQFDSIDYVQILIDGKTVSQGVGGIDISTTLAPAQF